jgi:hypothetical protein
VNIPLFVSRCHATKSCIPVDDIEFSKIIFDIVEIVNEALLDRSGSMVLKHMILNIVSCLEINDIGLPQLILMGACYI